MNTTSNCQQWGNIIVALQFHPSPRPSPLKGERETRLTRAQVSRACPRLEWIALPRAELSARANVLLNPRLPNANPLSPQRGEGWGEG